MNRVTSSLNLSVGDVVTMDEIRYEVAAIRSVGLGRRNDTIDIYDLHAIDSDQTTLRERSVSAAYLAYRLNEGEATIATGQQSLSQRLRHRARRSLPFESSR